ncbi:MAG TPA: HDOD domain-containing protein [Thermodesulfovibrionales bacterium]|jgi:putative nucleotidyltransferase with HDIG domain|nr:HDOD domain-containing protein [Thermodesulfovibrionales bacterium]
MNAQQLRDQIEQVDSLPTIPPVVRKLLSTIDSPTLSLTELGNVISKDQALTARLLKMVNSPIYGFPGRISSVSQALILLGLNVVKGMLLGISVFEIMEKTMMGLWEHSLSTAVLARSIAMRKGLNEPEEVMVSALLHDIGKVAMKTKFSEDYEAALSISEKEEILIRDAEEKVFPLSHAEAGGWLSKKWNFPVTLIEPIAYHHKPSLAKNAPLQTAIVHLADVLVRARGIGFAGDRLVPAVNPRTWEELALTESDMREALMTMEDSVQEAEDLVI